MDDITTSQHDHEPKPKKKTKTITMNRNLFIAGIAVIVLVVVFFLGSAYGSNKQKESQTSDNNSTSRSSTASNRWTAVGNVIEINDKQIKVKDSRNQEKTAAINKDTKIVNRKGQTIKISDVKKDQRVIASGEKDGDKLTATRIRVQQ